MRFSDIRWGLFHHILANMTSNEIRNLKNIFNKGLETIAAVAFLQESLKFQSTGSIDLIWCHMTSAKIILAKMWWNKPHLMSEKRILFFYWGVMISSDISFFLLLKNRLKKKGKTWKKWCILTLFLFFFGDLKMISA